MKKILGTVAAVAALTASAGANAALIQTIDLFNTSQDQLTQTVASEPATFGQSGFGSDIIGGYRDLGIDKLTTSTSTQGAATIGVSDGFLSFSTAAGVRGSGLVRWDGAAAATDFATPSMGLGASFNPFGTFFELLTISSDLGFNFYIEAYTSLTQWSRISLSSSGVDETLPNGVASYIPLLGFLQCGVTDPVTGAVVTCGDDGPVDFAHVGALQVIVNPLGLKADIDLRLNQVTEVPEPASLALVGLGLLGLGALRRREKKQA